MTLCTDTQLHVTDKSLKMLTGHWKAAAYFCDEGDYPSCPSVLHQKSPLCDQGKELLVLWEQHHKGMLPSSFMSKDECFKVSINDDLFLDKYLKSFCDAFKCFTHWISNRKNMSYYYLTKDLHFIKQYHGTLYNSKQHIQLIFKTQK